MSVERLSKPQFDKIINALENVSAGGGATKVLKYDHEDKLYKASFGDGEPATQDFAESGTVPAAPELSTWFGKSQQLYKIDDTSLTEGKSIQLDDTKGIDAVFHQKVFDRGLLLRGAFKLTNVTGADGINLEYNAKPANNPTTNDIRYQIIAKKNTVDNNLLLELELSPDIVVVQNYFDEAIVDIIIPTSYGNARILVNGVDVGELIPRTAALAPSFDRVIINTPFAGGVSNSVVFVESFGFILNASPDLLITAADVENVDRVVIIPPPSPQNVTLTFAEDIPQLKIGFVVDIFAQNEGGNIFLRNENTENVTALFKTEIDRNEIVNNTRLLRYINTLDNINDFEIEVIEEGGNVKVITYDFDEVKAFASKGNVDTQGFLFAGTGATDIVVINLTVNGINRRIIEVDDVGAGLSQASRNLTLDDWENVDVHGCSFGCDICIHDRTDVSGIFYGMGWVEATSPIPALTGKHRWGVTISKDGTNTFNTINLNGVTTILDGLGGRPLVKLGDGFSWKVRTAGIIDSTQPSFVGADLIVNSVTVRTGIDVVEHTGAQLSSIHLESGSGSGSRNGKFADYGVTIYKDTSDITLTNADFEGFDKTEIVFPSGARAYEITMSDNIISGGKGGNQLILSALNVDGTINLTNANFSDVKMTFDGLREKLFEIKAPVIINGVNQGNRVYTFSQKTFQFISGHYKIANESDFYIFGKNIRDGSNQTLQTDSLSVDTVISSLAIEGIVRQLAVRTSILTAAMKTEIASLLGVNILAIGDNLTADQKVQVSNIVINIGALLRLGILRNNHAIIHALATVLETSKSVSAAGEIINISTLVYDGKLLGTGNGVEIIVGANYVFTGLFSFRDNSSNDFEYAIFKNGVTTTALTSDKFIYNNNAQQGTVTHFIKKKLNGLVAGDIIELKVIKANPGGAVTVDMLNAEITLQNTF